MANYLHGPEVIENFEAGRVVRDVKAATTYLVGTAPVQDVHADAAKRQGFIEKDIVIRSKEDAVAAFGPFASDARYTIPRALHAMFNKDRGKGVGTIVVRNVFDPDVHKSGATPDPALVTATTITGGMDLAGKPRGLEGIYYTYAKLGYFPRRIIAPGFTSSLAVRQKMLVAANKIHGHAIVDLPPGLTKQQIIEQRGVGMPYQAGDDRLVYCAPHVKALDPLTGEQSLQPLSQHFAGVWNEVINREESDDDGGPAASPSNRAMPDVSGLEIPLSFFPGDPSSDTNLLNEAGIVTANMGQYGTGIVTWGAHASSFGAVAKSEIDTWLHVRTMYDVLHEAILFNLMADTDRRGIASRLGLIEDRIQRYINIKERDGWLYGGEFRFARQKCTPDEIAAGRFWYILKSAPISIMHRPSVESVVDLNFISTALGLSAGGANGS